MGGADNTCVLPWCSYIHPSLNASSLNAKFRGKQNIACTKTQLMTFIMAVSGKREFNAFSLNTQFPRNVTHALNVG